MNLFVYSQLEFLSLISSFAALSRFQLVRGWTLAVAFTESSIILYVRPTDYSVSAEEAKYSPKEVEDEKRMIKKNN